MTDHTCSCCGKPTDELSARFQLPDKLLQISHLIPDELLADIGSDNTIPSPSDDNRAYIRALLHIPLVGKHPEMLWCVWVEADLADVEHAVNVWNDDDAYAKVSMHGNLANTVKPWGMLGAEVTISVRDPSELPHVESSPDAMLTRVLTQPQPYESAVPVVTP